MNPGRFIQLNRSAQFLAYEDGSLIAESVATRPCMTTRTFLLPSRRPNSWPSGWGPPITPEGSSNWWTMSHHHPDTAADAYGALPTLREVFGQRDRDLVVIRLFELGQDRETALTGPKPVAGHPDVCCQDPFAVREIGQDRRSPSRPRGTWRATSGRCEPTGPGSA